MLSGAFAPWHNVAGSSGDGASDGAQWNLVYDEAQPALPPGNLRSFLRGAILDVWHGF